MKVRWKTLFVKITVWLIAEILLNLTGLDDLADYSEFIFESREAVQIGCPIPAGDRHISFDTPRRVRPGILQHELYQVRMISYL